MTSVRLLKIIFVILILVTLGELGYYVYIQFSSREKPSSVADRQINIPTLAIPDKLEQDKKNLEICVPASSQDSILNTALLEQLKFIPTALVSSTVTNQYQGKIVELNLKGGQRPIDKSKYKNTNRDFIEYKIGLKIKQKDATKTLDFYWDGDTLSRIKVLRKEGKGVNPINFSDLQIGDEIEVHETLDLMNKNCVGFQCVQGFNIYKT